MIKAHFTAGQTADLLQQSKNGVPNKALCERCKFSVSTLRRWQEQYAEGIRRELKQLESTGVIAFLFSFILATLLAIMLLKSLSACMMLFFLMYYVGYIRQFRKISAKHIQEENIFLTRPRRGARNAFYHFSWAYTILFVLAVEYVIVRIV